MSQIDLIKMFSRPENHPPRPHLPISKRNAQNPKMAQDNVVYLVVALMGGMILITKPVLTVFVLALMGYGKFYHINEHDKPRGLFTRENRSEHALHFGPSKERHDKKRASFQDLAKGLNLGLEGNKKGHFH